MVRCMLYSKGLSKRFWDKIVCCANHIFEYGGPTKAILQVTPEEKWSGRQPCISNFKVFGCECWARILDEKQNKLEPKIP